MRIWTCVFLQRFYLYPSYILLSHFKNIYYKIRTLLIYSYLFLFLLYLFKLAKIIYLILNVYTYSYIYNNLSCYILIVFFRIYFSQLASLILIYKFNLSYLKHFHSFIKYLFSTLLFTLSCFLHI